MMTPPRIGSLIVLCVVLAGGLIVGQERTTFTSSVDLVVLHVTVTDRRGQFVDGLTKQAFRVIEDGTLQSLSVFHAEDTPVSVGLLVDDSGSMVRNRPGVVAAVTAFAAASHPEDEFFALAFNERVERLLASGAGLQGSPTVLHDALSDGLIAHGRTALYDAISAALDELRASRYERKVIVVVSDGSDNASAASVTQVLRKAQASNAVIYTVALVDPLVNEWNPKVLRQFAEATGGRSFAPSMERLDDAFKEVSSNIRRSYTLAYVPSNANRDGGRRSLRVDVVAPDGSRLVARTRPGYLAPSEPTREEEAPQ